MMKQETYDPESFYQKFRLYGIKLQTWQSLSEAILKLIADETRLFRRENNPSFVYGIALAFARLGVPRSTIEHFIRGWVTNVEQLANVTSTVNYAFKRMRAEVREGKTKVPNLYEEVTPKGKVELDDSLSPEQVQTLLLLRYLSLTNAAGEFKASYAQIVRATQLSRSTAVYYLRSLIAKGYLAVLQQGKGHSSTVYQLTPKAFRLIEEETAE
jgi:DNA-binding MarR family transcriptional regulator